MRFGVSVPNRHPRPDLVVPYALAVAREADRAQADLLMVGDKHAVAEPLAQGPPLLGRLVGEAPGVRAFAALFLAPLWAPLHLAETIGTLAGLAAAAGRPLVPVLALGRRDGGAAALERPASGRVAALVRAIHRVRALAAGGGGDAAAGGAGRVAAEEGAAGGRALGGLATSACTLAPVERVWVAAERAPAVRRAGRLADGWLANAHHPLAELAIQCRALPEPAPGGRGGFTRAVRRDVICTANATDAREQAEALTAAGYRGFGPGALVAGDPAGCAAEVRRLAELGFDTVVVRPASPDPAAGAASVARFLAEVPAHLEHA
ncbi:MAG TPA: LLM class flavin-dependent oxidoreductase [Acidimicrobiales bacterium]